MKKYSNQIISLLIFIILILVLLNKELVSTSILSSLYIWYNTLVPSMFPMIVLSDIIITYNSTNIIPKFITKSISKLFDISENATTIFLFSLVAGFPTNGIIIQEAINAKRITKSEGEHLLLFCNFANPLFILQTIGVFYLKNSTYALIILISNILSNIIIGIIFRNKNNQNNSNIEYLDKEPSLVTTLKEAIYKGINSLLLVAGTITMFIILTTLISHIFNLNNILNLIIKSLLEMTMALSYLSNLNLNDTLKVVLSSAILSFSGLSIHLQIYSILENIKYKYYLKGRIISVVLSSIISFILMKTI